MTDFSYVGSELELFARASNWKAYYGRLLEDYLGDEVLEVGAGIGTTTEWMCSGSERRWVCLEPDPVLVATLQHRVAKTLPACCEARLGTLSELSCEEMFESIVYIDVLEHIEDDRTEVRHAAAHLREGGTLTVLAPAHQWLFTPFDDAIGHYRRYDRRELARIIPEDLECTRLSYLDCVGLHASLENRLVLKSQMPSKKQITLWDKGMVPLSRVLDPLLRYSAGKSVLGIWRKKPRRAHKDSKRVR
jgi:cyclopropane fatty-acyl-phospholipid synthase-like methyltransferase